MSSFRDKLFQFYWRRRRPLTLGVRGVVTNDEGQVLLIRHSYTPGWHFPGGGVEKGETTVTALKRELHEEACITLRESPSLISVHSNHRVFPNDHVLVFRIHDWEAEDFQPNGEVREIRFVEPRDPPEGVTGGTLRRLGEIFGDKPPSDDW